MMQQLSHPGIPKLLDVVRCEHMRTASLVLEHVPHVDWRELYPTLKIDDIRHYIRQLLEVYSGERRYWTTRIRTE